MNTYKITYSTQSGRTCVKTFEGESDNVAIEAFEFWAEGVSLQFENCEEVKDDN